MIIIRDSLGTNCLDGHDMNVRVVGCVATLTSVAFLKLQLIIRFSVGIFGGEKVNCQTSDQLKRSHDSDVTSKHCRRQQPSPHSRITLIICVSEQLPYETSPFEVLSNAAQWKCTARNTILHLYTLIWICMISMLKHGSVTLLTNIWSWAREPARAKFFKVRLKFVYAFTDDLFTMSTIKCCSWSVIMCVVLWRELAVFNSSEWMRKLLSLGHVVAQKLHEGRDIIHCCASVWFFDLWFWPKVLSTADFLTSRSRKTSSKRNWHPSLATSFRVLSITASLSVGAEYWEYFRFRLLMDSLQGREAGKQTTSWRLKECQLLLRQCSTIKSRGGLGKKIPVVVCKQRDLILPFRTQSLH